MMVDKDYMQLALIEAQQAMTIGEVPVGAIIVKDGVVIASAHNERERTHDATAHAELLAIRKACAALDTWRLSGATLYVTLEPCAMCAGAIMNARLDRLVYGAADSAGGAVHSWFGIPFSRNMNHALEVCAGVREEQCRKILVEFFAKMR